MTIVSSLSEVPLPAALPSALLTLATTDSASHPRPTLAVHHGCLPRVPTVALS